MVEKIQEEVNEIREVVADHQALDHDRAEEEMGDLLFAIAQLARQLRIDPETALRKANDKFTNRFTTMERAIGDSGRRMHEMPLDQLESEWQKAKVLGGRSIAGCFHHEDTKGHEATSVTTLQNDPADALLQHRHVEIHNESSARAGRTEVTDDLRHVHGVYPLNGLHFDNERPLDKQIDALMADDATAITHDYRAFSFRIRIPRKASSIAHALE